MIQTKQLQKHYSTNLILSFQDMSLDSGDLLLISGPSGTGKTSFLKILAKLDTNYKGIYTNSISDSEIGYFFHDFALIKGLTIIENIILGNRTKKSIDKNIQKQKEEIIEIAKKLHIEDLLNKKVDNLSSGQYQRICLLRAFVGEKKLLILDEPSSHLDQESATYVLDLLLDFHYKGKIICISSHDHYIFEFFKKNINNKNIRLMQF